MINMVCVCTIWSLYFGGPLSINIPFIEKPVLPVWNVFLCAGGQSQMTYFLPASSEVLLTPNLETDYSKLSVF
jgi:hypothetical protein